MKSVKLIVEYETKTGPVTMDIKTGQGQLGVHYAKIGNRIIYKGEDANVINVGKTNALKNKKIRIVTVVSVLNQSSRKTSVTYCLKGGKKISKWLVDEDVDTDKAVLYVAEISFK